MESPVLSVCPGFDAPRSLRSGDIHRSGTLCHLWKRASPERFPEPSVSKDYIFLGLTYAALDRREPAQSASQHALSLDPKGSARAHYYLAALCIRESRTSEAISELDAYLAALPDAPDKEKVIALRSQLRRKQ